MKEFSYEKYIWQIQFQPWYIFPKEYTYNLTIEYLNRTIAIRRTPSNAQTVKEKIYEIDNDESYEELLSYSEISQIRKYENTPEDELRQFDWGYRDGWRLKFLYFTKDDPPRTDGTLGTIYKGNPLEEILGWVRKNIAESDVEF